MLKKKKDTDQKQRTRSKSTYEARIGNMASYLTTNYARGRKNWLKGEHIHQNSEPATLFELDHTNSHSYPRLLKF